MVKNFLKNGNEIGDLTGHVVRLDDCREAYEVLDRIRRKEAAGYVSTEAG